MGLRDRDYFQENYDDGYGSRRRGRDVGGMAMVSKIIILNVVLFLLNGFLTGADNAITGILCLKAIHLFNPIYWWELLTYGFVHDPKNIMHIGGNMLAIFFLGYDVEQRLGSREFLRFYLATVFLGGLAFALIHINSPMASCLGASGGVVGVVVLYACMFPRRMLLIMGIFPAPAWVVGVICVGADVLGSLGHGDQGIAYSVHLAGAAFAFLYHSNRWNFGDLLGGLTSILKWKPKRKPEWKIYREDDDDDSKKETKSPADQEFDKRLDEILDRYGKVGESGLTQEERDFLKRASKKYKDRK